MTPTTMHRDTVHGFRDALATLRDGGYDRDVMRIELGSGEATDTQTVATIERTQARLKGM